MNLNGRTGRRRGRYRGTRGEQDRRFDEVYDLGLLRPLPYPMQPVPETGAMRQRVRQLVESLADGGVDEGTGAALDGLISSWTAGWIATLDSWHTDHEAVVQRLVGHATEQVAAAAAAHEHDLERLASARRDLEDARRRLGGDVPAAPAFAHDDGVATGLDTVPRQRSTSAPNRAGSAA